MKSNPDPLCASARDCSEDKSRSTRPVSKQESLNMGAVGYVDVLGATSADRVEFAVSLVEASQEVCELVHVLSSEAPEDHVRFR